MVVPYKHTADIELLSDKANIEIMRITARAMKALQKVSQPQGFNFGANLGRAAGAGIDKHVHFHIVPRWTGDTNFMPVLADVKLISEDMRRSWRALKKTLKSRQ
jgi:ATP adenylyltransferase